MQVDRTKTGSVVAKLDAAGELLGFADARRLRSMIAKVERRLGVVFQRAMLVALAGIGCSTKAADGRDGAR